MAPYKPPTPEQKRRYNLRARYGITQEDYSDMADQQDNKCAICGRERTLIVDHDHDSGLVRGLLCHTCNTGIGKLGDAPALLIKALQYLEEAPAKANA